MPLGRVDTFDAENANVALFEIGDELGDGSRSEVDGRKIERHRLPGEKALGALQGRVEVGEPVREGRLRRDCERRVGARPEHQRLALAKNARHCASPLVILIG